MIAKSKPVKKAKTPHANLELRKLITKRNYIKKLIQTKYRWNTHNGFEFSYIITSIGAEIVGVRQWVVKTSIPEKVQSYKYT